MPDLSILIVNYNTKEHLKKCLESIFRHQGELSIESIVVDNGSIDGSASMIREFGSRVRLIEPGTNTWFTGGNNVAAKSATGDYLWILNPDTIVQADTMQKMIAYLKAHPDVGAVTSLMRFPDGRAQPTCSMTPRYLDLLLGYSFLGILLRPWRDQRRKMMFYEDWNRETIKEIEVAPDSNIMLKRDLFLEIGSYDESMKLYFTEDDLCRRIIDTGKSIHYLPDALLLHYEHASVEQVQRLASQVYFQDLLSFCAKYYGRVAAGFLQALLIPTRWAMDLAQRLRGEKKSLAT
jgi:GT2 family glycosyltransferase